MRRVSIIQREIPHYRVRFFEELYAQGKSQGLDIMVYSGAPPVTAGTPPAFPYHVLFARRFGRKKSSSYWMYGLEKAIVGSDVVVAPQELQCLTVPYLWMKRKRLCKTWVWWGHGYNFQASVRPSVSTKVKEFTKRFLTKRGDGVITYTAKGAEYWRQQGLPADRVFPYYNTIDVEGLRTIGKEITAQQLIEQRQKLGIEDKRVLLFAGRLYAEKKVDFLLRAFALLKTQCPDVALLIVGDGEEREKLERLSRDLDLRDVHFLGEVIDPKESAVYFLIGDLMVIPAYIGLAIVHGFSFGLPMLTTDAPGHGPEYSYLSSNCGSVTREEYSEYARAMSTILDEPERLEALKQSVQDKANSLQLCHSVTRFLEAISALSH